MRIKLFQPTESRQLLWQALMLALPVLLLLCLGLWVYGKHQWALQQLATVEPRYARMLGMREQQSEIAQALQRVQAVRAQYLHSSAAQAGAQVGAAVQQQLRAVMSGAGLSVTSSQVRSSEEEQGPYERVMISMTVDGDIADVYTALQGLREIRPVVWIDELTIERSSSLENTGSQLAPALSVQLVASILKSKGA